MASPSPDVPPAVRPSAVQLLADPVCRGLVVLLGEAHGRGVDGLVATEESVADATPRQIRSRLRTLERAGVVEPAPLSTPGQPQQWRLTTAGRDLYRLLALMTRVVMRASQLAPGGPPVLRERAVAAALENFADPVAMRITKALAASAAPIGPTALEAACHPVARRTLYRRLTPLLELGVVERIGGRTVPRTTFYALSDLWRPTAAIPMLAAWWETRHSLGDGQSTDPADYEGVLNAVLPQVHLDGSRHDGKVLTWEVTTSAGGDVRHVEVAGERLRVPAEPVQRAADAGLTGTPHAWNAAMASDRRDGLVIAGDAALAGEAIGAVRAALLAYVR